MNALLPQVDRIQFREVAGRPSCAATASTCRPPATARRRWRPRATLAAQGIADYYVVTAGEQNNTVSLGIVPRPGERDEAPRRRSPRSVTAPWLEPRTERGDAVVDRPGRARRRGLAAALSAPALTVQPVACQ